MSVKVIPYTQFTPGDNCTICLSDDENKSMVAHAGIGERQWHPCHSHCLRTWGDQSAKIDEFTRELIVRCPGGCNQKLDISFVYERLLYKPSLLSKFFSGFFWTSVMFSAYGLWRCTFWNNFTFNTECNFLFQVLFIYFLFYLVSNSLDIQVETNNWPEIHRTAIEFRRSLFVSFLGAMITQFKLIEVSSTKIFNDITPECPVGAILASTVINGAVKTGLVGGVLNLFMKEKFVSNHYAI